MDRTRRHHFTFSDKLYTYNITMKFLLFALVAVAYTSSLCQAGQAQFDAETCKWAIKIQKRFCMMDSFKVTCPNTFAENCSKIGKAPKAPKEKAGCRDRMKLFCKRNVQDNLERCETPYVNETCQKTCKAC